MICSKIIKRPCENAPSSNIDFNEIKKRATQSPETARQFLSSVGVSWNKSGKVVIRPITVKK